MGFISLAFATMDYATAISTRDTRDPVSVRTNSPLRTQSGTFLGEKNIRENRVFLPVLLPFVK